MNKTVGIGLLICLVVFVSVQTVSAATVKGIVSTKVANKQKAIKVTKDQAICGKSNLMTENAIISKSGGVKNAVVQILGAGEGKPGVVEIAQNGCQFVPHVITTTAESAVVVNNNDGITHNLHTFGFENDPVNFSQPGTMKTKKVDEGFEVPEVIKVQCDIHEWMNAWVVVTDGSAASVSATNGAFEIKNVKPGKYKVLVWHEKLGEIEKDITVKNGDNILNISIGE